ncbi:hypothetical protein HispidOSU_001407, partial [Sigmodon hispidus]
PRRPTFWSVSELSGAWTVRTLFWKLRIQSLILRFPTWTITNDAAPVSSGCWFGTMMRTRKNSL